VNEPVLVGVSEARGDFGRDLAGFRVVERPRRLEAVLERPTRQVLEHHVRTAVLLAVVVEPGDVRMRQRGDGLRLALEAGRVGVAAQELDRDLAAELHVVREPDLGHGARAELVLEAITAADRLVHRASSLWATWPR
jgi:hypothetical protein